MERGEADRQRAEANGPLAGYVKTYISVLLLIFAYLR
jgi:hypothetical protein